MQATLHAEICKPILAICRTTCHSSQQCAVNLNDLLDCLTSNPVSSCGSRVCANYNATLEAESKSGGSVGNLDGAVGIRMVVSHGAEPGRWLLPLERPT